jgi:hypothetical protein
LILGLLIGPTSAWSAESSPAPPPLPSVQANAFSLQLAAGTALLGAGLFGLAEATRMAQAKDTFVGARPLFGWAVGGAAGGAASGLGLALAADPQPSWWGAAAAGIVGLAAGTGGALWLNQLAAGNLWTERHPQSPEPNEFLYSLVGLTLPVVTTLLSSVTYQGVRLLTTPQPVPTPTPLQTPWPAPTPPVRQYL